MSASPVALSDLHPCPLGGTAYVFRTPDLYDPARMRRLLTRQKARTVLDMELTVAAKIGLTEMAAIAGDPAEGERQVELREEAYALMKPVDEDDIDEPDFERRAAIAKQQTATRAARLREIAMQVAAINANLERHCTPYAELKADREFWNDVSRIEIVRLLLVSVDGRVLPRDDDGLITQAEYRVIPANHREDLATFAFRLLAPDETQRKN